MKSKRRIMILAVLAGLVACVLDAFFDYLLFYDSPFLDVLLFDVAPMEVYFRGTLVLLFVIFGFIQVRLVARHERTERALRESEEKFRVLFEAAPVGLGVTNMSGKLIAFNEAILNPGGYTPNDMATIDTVADLYFDPDERNRALQLLQEEGAVRQLEVKFKRKDGTSYDALLSLRPVTIQDIPHLQAVVEDVTERNKVARELVRLERLRALGEMSAGVSHNLNNILSVVLGYATLLQEDNKDPTIAASIDEIVASTVRASDLVKRLHRAVRTEGEQPQEPVDLNKIIRETVLTTRPRWHDETGLAGIAIEVIMELEAVPQVCGTVNGLNEILTNLLLNAVDAMPDGGSITIRTAPDDSDGVQLVVQDTGVGMDEATRQRLFEPFFTTKMDVGTGLGLSTIYGTVTRWEGSIDVQSAPGQGAVFTIVLPAWKGAIPQQKDAQLPSPNVVRRSNILVVEDDDHVAEVVTACLQRDHVVYRARDGREAIGEKFAGVSLDVAFVDLGLPDVAGDKVALELRQRHPSLATILITGWHLQDDDPRLQAFDHHLQKPFSLAKVRQMVAVATT
jgi:PAS domain S-box-containing protein